MDGANPLRHPGPDGKVGLVCHGPARLRASAERTREQVNKSQARWRGMRRAIRDSGGVGRVRRPREVPRPRSGKIKSTARASGWGQEWLLTLAVEERSSTKHGL